MKEVNSDFASLTRCVVGQRRLRDAERTHRQMESLLSKIIISLVINEEVASI